VRIPVQSEKLRQAKVVMIRLTKLIRVDSLTLDGKCNITGKGLSLMWGWFRMYLTPSVIIDCQSSKDLFSQRSKTTHIGEKGTMGNPKDRKVYGFGGFVVDSCRREPGIRFYSSSNNIKPSGSDILKELKKMNTNVIVNFKVIHIISNINILILAYKTIKNAVKNTTQGDGNKILDEISINLLQNISSDLKAGKFEFSLVRKIYISKRNKKKSRPLGVESFKDKIVQMAMLMVLKAIFEPLFINTSHGFRPGKGSHTALKRAKNTFSNLNWVIEGEVFNCYDTINHQILLNIIKKRINCEKTLTLLKKFLVNPYKDNGHLIYPKIGTFQGNSLSLLLCDIFLHELDNFMENYKKSFDKKFMSQTPPSYHHFQYLLYYNKIFFSYIDKRKLSIKLRSLATKDFKDPNFKRLQYIRYANNFLVGIIGKHLEAISIQQEIKNFLLNSLSLNLNLDKTYVTNFNRKRLNFLGTFIKGKREKEKKVHIIQSGNKKIRSCFTFRRLEAPISEILEKGLENGFFKKTLTGKFVPTFCGKLVNLDHADVIRFYNQKICGILNYYSFVDNKKSLGSFVHGLKHSCALTLALKFKLRHRAKVFKKFGKTLKCPETEIELYIPKSFSRDQKFFINPEDSKTVMEKR